MTGNGRIRCSILIRIRTPAGEHVGMGQHLHPLSTSFHHIWRGWTSICQLLWCSPRVPEFWPIDKLEWECATRNGDIFQSTQLCHPFGWGFCWNTSRTWRLRNIRLSSMPLAGPLIVTCLHNESERIALCRLGLDVLTGKRRSVSRMALFSPFISAPLGPVFGQTDLAYKENLGDGSDTK